MFCPFRIYSQVLQTTLRYYSTRCVVVWPDKVTTVGPPWHRRNSAQPKITAFTHGMPGIVSLLSRLSPSRQTPLLLRCIDFNLGSAHRRSIATASRHLRAMNPALLASGSRASLPAPVSSRSDRPRGSSDSRHSTAALARPCQTSCSRIACASGSLSAWSPPHARRHSVDAAASAAMRHPAEQVVAEAAGDVAGAAPQHVADDFLAASSSFDSFGLDPRVVEALRGAGFGAPSQVHQVLAHVGLHLRCTRV